MKLNLKSIALLPFAAALVLSCAQTESDKPVYLDENQPLEARVEDALSRMTSEEKV